MKIAALVLLFMATAIATAAAASYKSDSDWKNFKQAFGKTYKDSNEEAKRRLNWEKTRDTIAKHNAEAARGRRSFIMAENELSDRDEAEIRGMLGARAPPKKRHTQFLDESWRQLALRQSPPPSLDLRTSPCMPAIKSQGSCGSCWAFTATTPLEYLTCKATNRSVVLSESQLISCSFSYGNNGCKGGWYGKAWNYVMNATGQAFSCVLPYSPVNGTCTYVSSIMKAATLTSYAALPQKNETLIMQALATYGPLATALWVNTTSYNPYKSGVYTEPTCPNTCATTEVNHGVVLVGYGTSNTSIPYWIVRNHWATTWGDKGYFMIQRGVNMCNIECFVNYITI